MELQYEQGKIVIENKVITTLEATLEEGLGILLEEGLGIRIAKEDMIIPHIELKFPKDEFDTYSIENRVKVIMEKNHLFISPMELQIPYKLYLGSEKNIEDAVYLWDIFKEKIDLHLLKKFMKALDVTGEAYGVEI